MKEQDQTISLLNEAAFNIKSLRAANQLMSARLQMFDDINAMIRTNVSEKSMGMSPDVVYQIEKHIASLQDSEKTTANL